MKILREYISALLREDPMGFVHDLAAASDQFGEKGQPFFGGNPGKGGGKAIKRAFSANADYNFLNTLNTVHWTTDIYGMKQLMGKGKDELSTVMTLPGENTDFEAGEYGLWIKGRITLAANDQDQLFTGFYHNYGKGPEGSEDEISHRDKSSGRNKRPTVSKDFSRYGKLQPDNEFHQKMARNIPYVLDRSTWDPTATRTTNEALVDNWRPVGIVLASEDEIYAIENVSYVETREDVEEETVGVVKQILLTSIEMGIPVYNYMLDELWSPK